MEQGQGIDGDEQDESCTGKEAQSWPPPPHLPPGRSTRWPDQSRTRQTGSWAACTPHWYSHSPPSPSLATCPTSGHGSTPEVYTQLSNFYIDYNIHHIRQPFLLHSGHTTCPADQQPPGYLHFSAGGGHHRGFRLITGKEAQSWPPPPHLPPGRSTRRPDQLRTRQTGSWAACTPHWYSHSPPSPSPATCPTSGHRSTPEVYTQLSNFYIDYNIHHIRQPFLLHCGHTTCPADQQPPGYLHFSADGGHHQSLISAPSMMAVNNKLQSEFLYHVKINILPTLQLLSNHLQLLSKN